MRNLTAYIIAFLVVGVFTLSNSKALAQPANKPLKNNTDTAGKLNKIRQLKTDLSLSEQQAVSLQQAIEDNKSQILQLKQQQGYTPQQKQQQLINLSRQGQAKIMALLNPEQQQRFRDVIAQRAGGHLPTAAQREEKLKTTLNKLSAPLSGKQGNKASKGSKL